MDADTKKMRDEVCRAIEQGRGIQKAVRDITLKALTRGELDQDAIRKVTGDVVKGVQEAATVQGVRAKEVVAEAVAGVDEALAHAAQALKLSIEEAAGRAEKFSREDLAKARSSLKNIEGDFLDSLRETARAGRGTVSSILDDLIRHAQDSGTAVGRQLGRMGGLSDRMTEAGRAQFEAGVHAAVSSTAMTARIASGVLAGIADSLDTKPKKRSR
jgi:F0F1-type ATP synthase membrane subunit b/b'